LVKPLREAEMVAALERAIHDIQLRNERQHLASELAESNRQLERRVRELTTLFGIGKAVTSTTNQSQLFSKLMEGSLFVTQADMGYLLLQEEGTPHSIMRAQSHLPPSLASKLLQVWDDGVSGLVMMSGEALAIDGEGLAKFKLSRLGKAALIAPIKVKDKPIGVVGVVREDPKPFNERDQAMLEAVADYASISLVNARLFQALETRAQRYQQMVDQDMSEAQLEAEWLAGLKRALRAAQSEINKLREKTKDKTVKSGLSTVDEDMLALLRLISEREEASAADSE